jgi:DNA repair protein RecO (recombination protein O)
LFLVGDWDGQVPRYYKTEAIVLRSIRLREADRVVYLYTSLRGRVGAVAKGVRRTRSRFGGRLEPFFRLRLVLYEGRGELHTVTQAETVESYPRLREHGASLRTAATACESVLRLFSEGEANAAAYNLLCHELQLLDAEPSAAGPANLLAFRLKLLLAAGFLPELSVCVHCGARLAGDPSAGLPAGGVRFSPSAGGVTCFDCGAGDAFELGMAARSFMTTTLAAALPAAAPLKGSALSQVDRAVVGTLEHHAHVHLRSVA